ncbi:LmbE family protein [Caldanaerobacter subterraneus subsp. yonseiensis KB-1]|uniref:LmbE family protein n=1 Tax=Caldanaerobacter subterraneus subsp. yonseiensis KB-1 TaxID=1388761 RepID=U5CLK6_CALSX|nr:PIG-L family deacetylase [Caldanaerobacter subterraneus]ERM90863.1 LmbE family protein [Caldanaerobacter subterraneus subsp. yonseiensis KB-1]
MNKKIEYIVIAVLIIFITFVGLELKTYNYESKTLVKKLYPTPKIYQRVLVFAPHPDDETLASAGLIQDTLRYGGEVKVVVITNGDSFKRAVIENYDTLEPKPKDFLRLGHDRQKETISALKYLGVNEENIIFLGYPDKGLAHLWWQYWNKPYTSLGTKRISSPYNNSYTKKVEYKGENVVKDLKKIIKEYNPTLVVYPHPNELHPDHWATNSFVKYTLYLLEKENIPQFLYIVHYTDWPLPFGKHPQLNLNPPQNLLKTGTEWHLYPLTKTDIEKKGETIMMYKTQIKVMKDFLLAFDRKTELYGFYKDGILKKYNKNRKLENYKAIIDPEYDNFRDYENGSVDITSVYAYTQNNNLHIAIKCRQAAKPTYEYNLYGILFKEHKEVARISAKVINGKLFSTNGKAYIKNGIVYLTIPVTIDFNAIYLSTSTTSNKHLIDKTAWKLLEKER